MCRSCKLLYWCVEEVVKEAYQLGLVSETRSRVDLVRLVCPSLLEEDICASCLVRFLYNLRYLDKLLPRREFFPSEARKFLESVAKGEDVNPELVECQEVCGDINYQSKVETKV